MDLGTAVSPMEMSKSSSVQLNLAAVSTTFANVSVLTDGELATNQNAESKVNYSLCCDSQMVSRIRRAYGVDNIDRSIQRASVCLDRWQRPHFAPFPTTTPRTDRDVFFVAAAKFHDATATEKTDTDVPIRPHTLKDVAICSSPIFAARRRHCSKVGADPNHQKPNFPFFKIWRQTFEFLSNYQQNIKMTTRTRLRT
jgi:hypothetical protein